MLERELIAESLNHCAERSGDIVQAVFHTFFARDSQAHALMAHTDPHMHGRMFEGMLELFLNDHHFDADGYLQWELENHIESYAATPAMYDTLLAATVQVVAAGAGASWTPAHERAWSARCARIMSRVHEQYAAGSQRSKVIAEFSTPTSASVRQSPP